MSSSNATTIGTYFNLQLDDRNEVDFQWNGNGNLVTALSYAKGDQLNTTATVNFNTTFPVTSPHSNVHGISLQDRSNVKHTRLTGQQT
jgi:hypothetical protein